MDWGLPAVLRIVGVSGVVVWSGFSIWRQTRFEFDQEKVLSLIVSLGWWFAAGSIAGRYLISRDFGWWVWGGIILSGWTLRRWCRINQWDFWEWFDLVAGVYLGAGVLASLILGLGNWYYALVFASGWVIAGWTARNYRKIRWYKSGKPGMVGLVSLMWSAAGIIVVALLKPGNIYWVGLSPEQWISAWILVAAGGTIYLRSGRQTEGNINVWQKLKKARWRG
ncbi:hypothetical protein A2W16_00025 [Candidatus Amesbacteria bacterium RBG_16_48_31]|nr:MAG: hypothetical protein A2W16_00025 [Candidatus Amesbacteria bacterium RBG_16_48_31]